MVRFVYGKRNSVEKVSCFPKAYLMMENQYLPTPLEKNVATKGMSQYILRKTRNDTEVEKNVISAQ